MIMHSKLCKMKNKILPNCLQENYRDSRGEFNNTSRRVFGAARVSEKRLLLSSVQLNCACVRANVSLSNIKH